MNHDQMLEKLGLNEHQYRHLMRNFLGFCRTLDADQKRVIVHSLPTLAQAARSFGPDATVEDFEEFCGAEILACGMHCFLTNVVEEE